MAWAFVAAVDGTNTLSGTTLDCSSALNISAGDLIVAAGSWEGGVSDASIAVTDASNAMTMLTVASGGGNYLRIGYKIAADANAAATFRLTLGTARAYRFFQVLQFRPDAGETVTLDAGPSPATATSTACQSGNISTTGDDEIVIAFEKQYTGQCTESAWQIADANADGQAARENLAYAWYKAFTSAQSNIHGQLTFSVSSAWLCDIVAFKSAAAGGLSIPVAMAAYRKYNEGVVFP
jgi:hypothetical protein